MSEQAVGEGRAVVVSGASSGLGRACAQHLDRLGFRVFAGVRRLADAEALQAATSPRLHPVMLDVTREESVAQAAAVVSAQVGDVSHREVVGPLLDGQGASGVVVSAAIEPVPTA